MGENKIRRDSGKKGRRRRREKRVGEKKKKHRIEEEKGRDYVNLHNIYKEVFKKL